VLRRLSIAAAIMLLVGVAAGATLGESLTQGLPWANVLRWILAFAALTVLCWLVLRSGGLQTPQGLGAPGPLPPTKHEIALAYYNVGKIYNSRALKLLVNMMIDLPYYLERITENVTLAEETPELRVTTRQVFRVGAPLREQADRHNSAADDSPAGPSGESSAAPGKEELDEGGVMLAPIALVEKGTLLDGFTVTNSAGNEVPTLSYNQTRGLLAHVVETIINMAPRIEQNIAASGKKAQLEDKASINRIKANLVTAVCSPRRMKKKPPAEQSLVRTLLDSAKDLPVQDEWKERIRAFCETLVDYYLIVAEIPPPAGGYALLTYTQQIPVDSSAQGAINRIRSRVGLSYSAFDIPLNIFALQVDAYHMEVQAAPSQYVFDHHLERMNSTDRVDQAGLAQGPGKPYVRLHHNSAGTAAHLYVRRQAAGAPPEPVPDPAVSGPPESPETILAQRFKSVVELREIPPGTMGIATAISIVTAVIITFFAVTQFGQYDVQDRSDIPALIIALPGVASVVMGSWLDLANLRRASLSAYLGLGASVTLSLAAALYSLLGTGGLVPGRVSFTVADGVDVRSSIGWLILAALAITCCLFLLRDVVSSSRYYANQVKERIKHRT